MTKDKRDPLVEAYNTMFEDPEKPSFELEKQMSWAAARMLAIALLLSFGIILAVWGAKKIKEVRDGGTVSGGAVCDSNRDNRDN